MCFFLFFFFNDTPTTEIYTLSLHDALPISPNRSTKRSSWAIFSVSRSIVFAACRARSEEHTSELQSRQYLVSRLLLEQKKNKLNPNYTNCLKTRTNRTLHHAP